MSLAAHTFHPTALREYDIRGIVGGTITVADATAIGAAFATMVRRQGGTKIALGYDGRLSSPELADAVSAGMRAAGIHVMRIGLGPTPMLYWSTYHLGADAGLQITGSHNPPEYNGFKFTVGGGAFYGDQIQEIGRIAASGAYAEGAGAETTHDIFDAYVARLAQDFDGGRPLTVVWDAGNGAGGPAMKALTERLPGKHICLFADVDGTFPNHHPDPTVEENLVDLKRAVAEHGADIGIGFDGDADRIGVIDNQGRVLWGDQILTLYARDVLKHHPGSTVIADVKTSQGFFDDVKANGGQPLMWKTGHSLLKAKMKEIKAPLAGEMSGHIFFADRWYGFDDALYCAVRMLNIVAGSAAPLSTLRDGLPRFVNTPELRFQCSEERKFQVVEEVKARLAGSTDEVVTIDGVRVITADGWWLLRASNTQDVLVARCEASSEAGLQRLKAAVTAALAPSGIVAPV